MTPFSKNETWQDLNHYLLMTKDTTDNERDAPYQSAPLFIIIPAICERLLRIIIKYSRSHKDTMKGKK